MRNQLLLPLAALTGLTALPGTVLAAAYTVNCGTGGSVAAVQTQLAAITGTNNTLTITGTCVGELQIQNASYLTIQGLSLTGDLLVASATHISLSGLTIYGSLSATSQSTLNVNGATVNGYIQIMHESSASLGNITVTEWVDPASGAGGEGIICLSSSECTFSNTTVSGSPSGNPGAPTIGVQVASAARLNFASGRISGFDWGVHVWNHGTAFFDPDCNSLSIDSNGSLGVYVRDGGLVKLEGLTPDAVSGSCPGTVLISNNGTYGVRAEGGGEAFLYNARIIGHSIDGVRVQDGSSVKIRSSTLDAASTSGRSARVKSQSHLWFDEENYGPTAASSLAGPVCVTNNSSVATDNSATVLNTVTTCSGP